MAQPHDILLEHLTASVNVQLVARLHDPEAVGNTDTTYLHVFVPDLHLVSDEVRRTYQYGFDWRAEFTALTTALLETWDALEQAGHRFTVTQLGDFVDLWRQSNAMQTLRTEPDSDGQPAAPNLTVLVIGHTHHARLVVDHTAHRVLMDCGAWIESYQ